MDGWILSAKWGMLAVGKFSGSQEITTKHGAWKIFPTIHDVPGIQGAVGPSGAPL